MPKLLIEIVPSLVIGEPPQIQWQSEGFPTRMAMLHTLHSVEGALLQEEIQEQAQAAQAAVQQQMIRIERGARN